MKTVIDIEAVEELLRKIHDINIISFDEIVWRKNGEVIDIDSKILEEWKFIGLNNTDFARFKTYDETYEK